jgi:glycogen(starch) synthase
LDTPVDICMFVHNDVSGDARVLKEAGSLAAHGWKVVVVGIGLNAKDLPEVETTSGFTIIRVMPRLLHRAMPGTFGKLLRLVVALPAAARRLRRTRARVYHAHDFIGLLVMALAGIRRPVVYDSHELFFDRFPEGMFTYPLKYVIWRLRPLEKLLARRAVAVVTVGDAVADRLVETLGVSRPTVVRNAVDLRETSLTVPLPRREGVRVVGHSGVVTGGRHLPELVAALLHLPEDIAVALVGDGRLRKALVEQAAGQGTAERLLTIFPVTPRNMVSTLAQADAAIMLITASRLNYRLSLPNKFFEAVAAGLPIVSSPIPEVARLLEQYDLGILCDPTDPRAIAEAIMTILQPENLARYRANAEKARADLNWGTEEKKLVALYEGLLT